MSESLGSSGTFEVSTDGGTYTAVGEVVSVDLPFAVNAVDATSNDDGGNKVYLAGDFDSTAGVTFNYDASNAGQIIIMTNFISKTTLFWRARPTVGTGEPQWVFEGIITSQPIPYEHEAVIQVALDIQITGGVAKSNQ